MEQLDEKKRGGKCSGCKGKNPGLWCNICRKRARGERPAKPGQKGYPKTLDIDEALLRSLVRELVSEATGGFESRVEAESLEAQVEALREEFAQSLADEGIKDDDLLSVAEWFEGWCKGVDDRDYYTTADLQALARNAVARGRMREGTPRKIASADIVAGHGDVQKVREALGMTLLRFEPRAVPKVHRGLNAHGTHPFAGSGAGGSGFDNMGGHGTANSGGGLGAISAKRPIDPSKDLVWTGGKRK